ncbi:YraN family protein [Demequina sp. NBRC 110054]|uniref:YraN family protein n=1 Tax=Demequina sp. NBRC 110054 TaxID=1570343 RepID=UPI0009FF5093|nr:YraN family protein [Demequina sp. NBRC 110054]
MAAKDAVGRYGEEVAARRLTEKGWTVLACNWRCREGEIDIVAADGDALVVVEVKTRRGSAMGTPQEAVTARKLSRLRRLAAVWLASQDSRWPEVRIDVIAVTLPRAGAAGVEHLRAVG